MVNSLGYVTVAAAGTPVPITDNLDVPGNRVAAQSIFIQAHFDNAGQIYVGLQGMDPSTGEGVIAIIPAPATGSLPSFTMGVPVPAAGLNAAMIFLDADSSGDIAVCSYTAG